MSNLLRNIRAHRFLTSDALSRLTVKTNIFYLTPKTKFLKAAQFFAFKGYSSRIFTFPYKGYSTYNTVQCWKCGNDYDYKVSHLFCGHCDALQRPQSTENLFQLMGIEKRFDIDENALTRKYKNLQKQLHPDKYGTRSEKERLISEQYSSLVNKAYSTLLRPLTRGLYIMKLQGLNIPEKTELENDFLMEIMEKNEEVENATTEVQILQLNAENKKTINLLCKQLSAALNANDFNEGMKILSRLKYYDSIENEIKKVIRRMGIVE